MLELNDIREVVVGLGNTLLCDDGVGPRVARAVAERLPQGAPIIVQESMRGGLDLLEMLHGFSRAHLIDAIMTGKEKVGHIWRLSLDHLPPSLTLASSHEVDLPTALRLGEKLGYELPLEVVVWAVEVGDPYTISERMSAEVEAAVARCASRVINNVSLKPASAC